MKLNWRQVTDQVRTHKIEVLKAAAAVILLTAAFFVYSAREEDGDGLRIAEVTEPVAAEQKTGDGSDTRSEPAVDTTETTQAAVVIYVDVGGAVKNPGVVELSGGGRVYEAVALAGGLLENADTRAVNLAAVLRDGDKLYIPSAEEIAATGRTAASAAIAPGASSGQKSDGLVNLNTADSMALQTLSGVGPSTAAKIIAYRETFGGFHTIEELMEVSGIGEKTFEKLKASITV